MKRWLNVGVETGNEWPREPKVVRYDGRAIHLLPGGEKLLHGLTTVPTVSVAFEDPGPYVHPSREDDVGEPRCADRTEAHRVIKRFLSMLAWSTGYGVTEGNEDNGPLRAVTDHRPRRGGGIGGIFDYYSDCLPVPADEDSRFALAFYRDGLSAWNPPHQFLSFAKVLNLRLNSTAQIAWINAHADDIANPYARLRIEALRAKGEDIGNYLYVSGRCAIAHALGEPRVDPDDPDDLFRLHEDLQLIRALAARFIAHELGVKTPYAISEERWQERLKAAQEGERGPPLRPQSRGER